MNRLAFIHVAGQLRLGQVQAQGGPVKGQRLAVVSKADGPRVSTTNRRSMLGFLLAAATSAVTSNPACAQAESMREGAVRHRVGQLIDFRDRASSLISHLESVKDSDVLSADEVEYVARAVPVWLAPAIGAIEGIVRSEVDVGPGIDIAGRALTVHLAELEYERTNASRKGCIRELEEYIETLDSVLGKDSLGRFVHGRRWNGRAWVTL
jgi:hypothetical protein